MKEKYQELTSEVNHLWRYLWPRYQKRKIKNIRKRTNQRKLLDQ